MPIKSVSICPNPIFVVGCPRSGTSVLAHSLARHSQMWLGPESDYIAPLACLAKELYTFGTQRGERHWLSNQGVTLDTNPTRILKVYHGLLITNSSKELKKILDFLNLPYEEATTELYKSRKIINSSFKSESERERLKWQNSWSLEEKVLFASICGSLLVKLGYEKDDSWIYPKETKNLFLEKVEWKVL